jgi:hypothetical protein
VPVAALSGRLTKLIEDWSRSMADRNALGMIGLLLCAATLLVLAIGGIVVSDHLMGRAQIDDGFRTMVSDVTVR